MSESILLRPTLEPRGAESQVHLNELLVWWHIPLVSHPVPFRSRLVSVQSCAVSGGWSAEAPCWLGALDQASLSPCSGPGMHCVHLFFHSDAECMQAVWSALCNVIRSAD